jgi:hypothetical protein
MSHQPTTRLTLRPALLVVPGLDTMGAKIAGATAEMAQFSIGVGKVALPALRTVLAVLPHTALQSLVSSSGVPRGFMGCL